MHDLVSGGACVGGSLRIDARIGDRFSMWFDGCRADVLGAASTGGSTSRPRDGMRIVQMHFDDARAEAHVLRSPGFDGR
jgi:hypothetical protein